MLCASTVLDQIEAADPPSHLQRYQSLEREFINDLEQVAAKCDELDLPEQAKITRTWIAPRKSRRQVYYFTQPSADDLPATATQRVKQWHARFIAVRQKYADDLFALANEAAQSQQGELALRWMFEVHHENPEHEEAAKTLGISRRVIRQGKPNAGTIAHRQFGWPRGRWWTFESRHFAIESNTSAAACVELSRELEQVYDVWLQLFYPLWAKNEVIAGRFAGKDIDLLKPRRVRVVLFSDQQEYLKQLSKDQKNVQISSGVYLDQEKASLFFAGDGAKKSTQYHEITHQLIQETLEAPAGVAKENNVWMIEAAAIFMESLVLHDGYATLGGYDSDALQFARFRARGGDFQMPLAELAPLGREALQSHANVRKIYGQLGGLGHFFMEGSDGKLREPFLKPLLQVYQGRATPSTLAEACETTYEQLDRDYYDFLDVTDDMIARAPPLPTITGLSLRKTSVTDAGLKSFADCNQLRWLDLSLTQTGDAGFSFFPPSKSLTTLFLERTQITDESLAHLLQFPNLEEVYLSSTAITDSGVAVLPRLKKLKTLDLAGCDITDAALPALSQMKQLESLDVSGTKISPEGQARLKRSLPRLESASSN